ncbi:MAG TPA: hypothetical protein VE621_21215 [Bryobacteraceae bacterium]|jgi:hypothetical protein|nr:hypothetical protein [Bryobacteraceae bacterium]
MARRKKDTFDQAKEVRKLARERVGIVAPTRPIQPKDRRRKPKHKRALDLDDDPAWRL